MLHIWLQEEEGCTYFIWISFHEQDFHVLLSLLTTYMLRDNHINVRYNEQYLIPHVLIAYQYQVQPMDSGFCGGHYQSLIIFVVVIISH